MIDVDGKCMYGPSSTTGAMKVAAVFLPFILSGCYGMEQLSKVQPVITDPENLAIDLDAYYFPGTDEKTGVIAFKEAKEGSIKERNELQGLILRRSETACQNHKASIYTNAAVFNVSTGFLTSALAGAGAIVNGEMAASILAGTAALSNSTRSLVNEEVYQQMLSTAIISEIELNRKEFLADIYTKRSEATTTYTVEDAILDAERYNNLCSFYKGVASLVKKAGKSERNYEDVLSKRRLGLKKEQEDTQTNIDEITTKISEIDDNQDPHRISLESRRTLLMERLKNIDTQLSSMDSFM
ncbi:MAG: hypothetical protein JJ871_11100 [Thalassospira sp.]|uniref:hypothetical protein n=1 Tax=Thalassospira sp. TaxID=1912094 RepID=UPI001AFFE9E8|nr:hypothetical protein [Thalassospira sp.]MBO6579820.1 hypothetical protein [Thalassospira sp.]MBO6819595.1 hypothetical protein [Thalassospira sp.]MBO6888604.1 hypothetical protein [Thalassospira sp.]